MEIRVLFFGILKDFAGEKADITLPAKSTLRDLLQQFKDNSQLTQLLPAVAISVNQEYAGINTELKHGDEVAFLPPVSGGASALAEPPKYAAIVREPIVPATIVETVKDPSDGAVVIFDGIVRNNTRGRRTLYLDYESYEVMALKQMESLAAQALEKFAIRDVRMIHRLGRLQIGETSILIVVASAHRAAAFEACRWLIDTFKRTIPIWKKEYFENGAVWADGEAFPDEIPRGKGTH